LPPATPSRPAGELLRFKRSTKGNSSYWSKGEKIRKGSKKNKPKGKGKPVTGRVGPAQNHQ